MTTLQRFRHVLAAQGVAGVGRAIARRLLTPHARCFPLVRERARDARCFEIGGPSPFFARGGLMPVYPLAARVDNANFAATTIWEGQIDAGETFTFDAHKAPGWQVVAEATDLHAVPSACYDLVLSAGTIEHTANPLKALHEWKRILTPGGLLVLNAPEGSGTFDRKRPITTLAHLEADYAANRGEDDDTHFAEVLALHDASEDHGARTIHDLTLADRVARNAELRTVHQHVFDLALARDMVAAAGFTVLTAERVPPYHLVVLAHRPH